MRRPSIRWFDGLFISLFMLVSVFAVASAGLAPRDAAGGVAVIFAPWVSSADAMSRAVRAGGRLVRLGGFDSIVVVVPQTPDFARNVRAEGALLLADPLALTGCWSRS
jgi:hypothetical protein